MSSRLIPPKVMEIRLTVSMKACGLSASTSMSNTSMPAKRLNSTPLPSITGLGGQRAEVTQAENRGAVGNHCHQVALAGVLVGQLGIAGDFTHRLGDTRAVGQGQVQAVAVGLVSSTLSFPGRGCA